MDRGYKRLDIIYKIGKRTPETPAVKPLFRTSDILLKLLIKTTNPRWCSENTIGGWLENDIKFNIKRTKSVYEQLFVIRGFQMYLFQYQDI